MSSTPAQIAASNRYNVANVKQVKIGLNKKTDADVIAKLEEVPNIAGYIKGLIRDDIKTNH